VFAVYCGPHTELRIIVGVSALPAFVARFLSRLYSVGVDYVHPVHLHRALRQVARRRD
jgi:hypothetical protein